MILRFSKEVEPSPEVQNAMAKLRTKFDALKDAVHSHLSR
jgi:uncharacterized membrane-anchored protein YhcB (DUF1043 family)